MQNQDRVVTKLNLDLKLVEDQKNHLLKKELEMQDREVLSHHTLEVELFQWDHKIEITLFLLIKKKKL